MITTICFNNKNHYKKASVLFFWSYSIRVHLYNFRKGINFSLCLNVVFF